MDTLNQFFVVAFFAIGLVIAFFILFRLVLWAKKGSKGAIMLAAILAFLTPDPIFEKKFKIVQESKKFQKKEDESGDPPAI